MGYLSQLSIIILTYNRPEYIKRSLQYWNKIGPVIYVLDGSSSPLPDDFISKLSENINYLHYPISLFERIRIASKLPSTKYSILLSDDEFFIPSALIQCIKELEKDDELISCGGMCIGFKPILNDIKWYPEYQEQKNYQIMDNDPLKRMSFHMSNYTPSTIYSITKTEFWSKIVDACVQNLYPDPGTIELQLELSFSFFGKSKILPIIMWVRSNENEPHDKKLEIEFDKWWFDIKYSLIKKQLIQNLSSTYHIHKPTIPIEKINTSIEESLNLYIKWNNKRKVGLKDISFRSIIKLQLYNLIKKINILFKIKLLLDYFAFKSTLKKNKIFINIQEFEIIRNCILNFHKKQ